MGTLFFFDIQDLKWSGKSSWHLPTSLPSNIRRYWISTNKFKNQFKSFKISNTNSDYFLAWIFKESHPLSLVKHRWCSLVANVFFMVCWKETAYLDLSCKLLILWHNSWYDFAIHQCKTFLCTFWFLFYHLFIYSFILYTLSKCPIRYIVLVGIQKYIWYSINRLVNFGA